MSWNIGVAVGKFNPPHLGHLHLLNTAAAQVKHLFILLGDRQDQTIPADDRASWLQETVADNATVIITPDNLPAANEPWARRALDLLPEPPDVAFTSESWGPGWADAMGAAHVSVDEGRSTVAISATEIRNDIRRHFDHLIPAARAALAKRIVVAGAESTGKTTLALELARRYSTVWIPEYGRTYWEGRRFNARDWGPDEFVEIARRHHALTDGLAKQAASGLLISDTDALVTSVWLRRYRGETSRPLEEIVSANRPDLYLVATPDFDWVQDGTRESEKFRSAMHQWTLDAVRPSGVPYRLVTGSPGERIDQAIDAIEPLLKFPQLT